MKATLVAYDLYGPWDLERSALAAVGGSLHVVSPRQLEAAPHDAELLLNVAAAPAPVALLDRLSGLRCAVSYGIGVDWIDVPEAGRRGVMVVNMPSANVEDVATHAFALLLACARRLLELDRVVRSGGFEWPRNKPLHRLRGRRLGLLAFGAIPRVVAALANPFGLDVAAHDPFVEPRFMQTRGVEPVGLDELFVSSDILSVHVPSTPATVGIVDARRLALLPDGAIVLVTSRGDVYDPDALAAAVASGRLAAAGLDVFPDEPLSAGHPFARLENVVLTPHIAGYSEESIRDLHETAVAIIGALARGERPPGLLNPEVFE